MNPSSDRDFYQGLLRSFFDSVNDAIFVLCDEMKFIACNAAAERLMDESESTLTRHDRRIPIMQFLRDPGAEHVFAENFTRALKGEPRRFECSVGRAPGRSRRLDISLNKVGVEAGDMVIGVARDVTEHEALRGELVKLARAIEQTGDSAVITNRDGIIEYVNDAFATVTGYSKEEALGETPRLVKSGRHPASFYQQLWNTILSGNVFRGTLINRRKNGELYFEEKTVAPLRNEAGEITHFVSTGRDVTERMGFQERLDRMSFYDDLTGLPNRALLRDRLGQILARRDRHREAVAVLFLDLDHFKNVNDSLGHEAGDKLLVAVADRLRACVRHEDTLGRLGGDEFLFVLTDIATPESAATAAQKLCAAFAEPFRVVDREIAVTASIGIALYPSDGQDIESLMKNADTAMYRAKEFRRGTYRFYTADMTERAHQHLTLKTDLNRALERNEFRLHFQPLIDNRSGEAIGVEALLRWMHPEHGLMFPWRFIPLAEETGLILPIGEWVVREACAQRRQWREEIGKPVQIFVNISGKQLLEPGFVDRVAPILEEYCQPSDVTVFEVTESAILDPHPATLHAVKSLRERGVRIAIDDFGTGYSSLAYLRYLPVDILKMGGTFVSDITADPDAAELAAAVIAMGHTLRLKVVAECVETAGQLSLLRYLGCDVTQGYLYSQPLPAEEVSKFLKTT